ncbi:MobF family relaxase [Conexibacter woesei]|uniref:MobF family relaxase n=1 Tax=Conexibacter woesei TaxID=191495 RepID=UPI0002FF5BF6|nr:MobF family relaxase [Conexibacter woesei]
MLTIRKITVGLGEGDAARAAEYPLAMVNSPQAYARGDYYTVDEGAHPSDAPKASAMWVGSPNALAAIGLEAGAEVLSAQLESALQGRHVDSGEEVRKPGTITRDAVDAKGRPRYDAKGKRVREKVKGVTSLDMTFSVPKSVSVLWSQASPEQRAEIERALLRAANAALEHMVQTKGVVFRRGPDGVRVREPAVGMVATLALHVTARRAHGEAVPSPQLHVHGIVVGVERADGKLVTPDSFRLFKDDAPLEGAAVGRATLAHDLVGLGYRVESGTGRNERFFEIRGVPHELMGAMSGRTRDVERERARVELATGERLRGAALGVLASQTRAAKDKAVTPQEIAEVWSALGAEHGFGPIEAGAIRGMPGYRLAFEDRRDQARTEILRRMRIEGPTVSSGEARAIVYEVAPGRLSPAEAWELLDEMERTGELIALERNRVTTYEIRALETYVMEVATAAALREGGGLSEEARAAGIVAASAALGEGKQLDREQLDAVRALTDGAGWTTLTGRAGTGKGPTLNAVATAYRADGWQVIACANDGTTAQRLGKQIGAPALTIGQLKARTGSGTLVVDARTLLLIEEASKVGAGEWAEIAALVQRSDARVLGVGHDGQLGAIELPGLYSVMLREEAIPTAELDVIRRHNHEWMREYQVAIDEGRAREAIEILDSHGGLHFLDTREEAMAAMVAEWNELREPARPETSVMIVHGSNLDVDRVNVLAQEQRIEAGELGAMGVPAVDRLYAIHADDLVIVRESAYTFEPRADGGRTRRVENGQIGIVDSVDPRADTVRVWLEEPGHERRLVEFDQGKLRAQLAAGGCDVPALRLAYASHTYPIQGATVTRSADLAGHWSQGKEGTYVANTRATEGHSTFAAREDLGTDGTDEDRKERLAKVAEASSARKASLRYEWERGARINVPRPVSRPVPELPGSHAGAHAVSRAPAREAEPREAEPERAPAREEITVADPLEAHRDVLGDERTEELQQRAHELGESLPGRDEAWLHERQKELGDPFEQLDRGAARAARRFERDASIVHVRMEMTRREAYELADKAEALGSVGSRRERRRLEAQAVARRTLVERDRVELERLEAANQQLHDEGRHPDQWKDEHGERAARWAAVERELAIRRELEAAERAAAEREPESAERAAAEREPESAELEPELELEAELEPELELPDLPEPPGMEM